LLDRKKKKEEKKEDINKTKKGKIAENEILAKFYHHAQNRQHNLISAILV